MMQETKVQGFNASNGTYMPQRFRYNLVMTAKELAEISTDLIYEVSMRGVIVPKAALSSWLTPHSDGTYSAWIKGFSVIVAPDEPALVCTISKQALKDRIAITRLLLSMLEKLESSNPA